MKRTIFTIIAMCAMGISSAQGISDGLRYSSDQTIGTARFNALNGAFGALGGDFSAIGINPAGSAVFIKSSAAATISGNDIQNEASYFNNKTKSVNTKINLSQAGAVFVYKNPYETSKLKKWTLGINYQTSQDFDNEIFIKGTGNKSISHFFLNEAQGIPLELLQTQPGESTSDLYRYLGENEGVSAQNAFLGYQGFIIDPVDPDNPQNTQYSSNIGAGNFNQEYLYLSGGTNNKFTINLATQLNDNFYLGINLNTHSINFQQNTVFYEDNSNQGSSIGRVLFENNLAVQGVGLSGQIGAIMKIQEKLRIGLSLETPTHYNISEQTTQYLETRSIGDDPGIVTVVDPRILNIFEVYKLRTPGKVTASAAYIFGTQGLLSFDYSYKDFGSLRFNTLYNYTNDFNDLNTEINTSLKGASTFRLGGEYRIKKVSLRGGLRYEESPYKNEDKLGALSGFSLGFGYNFGNYNLDLSYARAEQERKEQLYSTGLTENALVNTTNSTIALTIGFAF